jgi:hypothetical protein
VLGWLVIAHGLSHAALPQRGSLGPTVLVDDWTPVALYAVGLVGFVAAGLGMLGFKPLDRVISPLLVLASGLSLVAITRFADPGMWLGAVCDVLLLLVGLWRASGGWPAHPSHGPYWHFAGLSAGSALLLFVTSASLLYPWHRTWGSTRDELLMPLPGDPINRNTALERQRAVTIDAPPEAVWPYVRALVDSNQPAPVLLPAPHGRTRLIMRTTNAARDASVFGSAVNFMTVELPRFLEQRRALLTIKQQAEEARARSAAVH